MRFITSCAALAACLILAAGCSQQPSSTATHTVTPGEASGTSGSTDEPIAVSGCVIYGPVGYTLTSIDDAIERTRGTSGLHRDDPNSRPTDANRGSENERARDDQNVSAGFGTYRLSSVGQALSPYVDREVDVTGRVRQGTSDNSMPITLSVESIKPTGAVCGRRQEEGNDRGVLPGQDLPRK